MKSKFINGKIAFATTMLFVLAFCCNADDALAGVYSNRREGFAGMSFVFSENGYGMYASPVAMAPIKWERQKIGELDCVVLTLYNITTFEVREQCILLLVESETHSLAVIPEAATLEDAAKILADGLPDEAKLKKGRLYFTTADLPEEYKEAFEKMPDGIAKAKLSAEYHTEARKKEEERLKAEQPRLDECLQMIRSNPACIFDFELTFYEVNNRSKVKQTPECRALITAFSDQSILFTEEILMKFLNKYKWNEVFYLIGPIFARDELGETARRKLHPQMIDYGKKLDYDWAGAFYKHPNTPLELVKEVRDRKDIPGALTRHLDKRLADEKSKTSLP